MKELYFEKPSPVFGEHDSNTIEQFFNVMQRAERGALMADGHLGYVMPVGGVVAYDNQVSICGVGFDIGCGNMAMRLAGVSGKDIKCRLDTILDDIQSEISFGVGRTNNGRVIKSRLYDWEDAASKHWDVYDANVRDALKALASSQLGTVGSGNHYVDILTDELERVWIANHFGSRGLGHKTATGFLNLAVNGKWDKKAKEQEVLLDVRSELGERYFRAMELCGQYAAIGRIAVLEAVTEIILGGRIVGRHDDVVHNHHNFAWRETHDGKELIVVRKGATPAFPGQQGFVGGSMGDIAVIVEGVESETSARALYSTVHGAGRVMSRREAAGRSQWKRDETTGRKVLTRLSEGKVSREMMNDWLKEKGVSLRGGGTDESPHVYRRLSDVLLAQGDTVRVKHTLFPMGVVMAGESEFDPYKD